MLQYFLNCYPGVNIPVEHCSYQINALFTHDIRNPKIAVHNLVNAVEWILFVDDGVKKDAECPDILLLTTIGFSGKDFGCCVI